MMKSSPAAVDDELNETEQVWIITFVKYFRVHEYKNLTTMTVIKNLVDREVYFNVRRIWDDVTFLFLSGLNRNGWQCFFALNQNKSCNCELTANVSKDRSDNVSFLTFGGFRETRNLFRFFLALDRRLEWLERAASHATRSFLRCRRATKFVKRKLKLRNNSANRKSSKSESLLHMHRIALYRHFTKFMKKILSWPRFDPATYLIPYAALLNFSTPAATYDSPSRISDAEKLLKTIKISNGLKYG